MRASLFLQVSLSQRRLHRPDEFPVLCPEHTLAAAYHRFKFRGCAFFRFKVLPVVVKDRQVPGTTLL